jgi:Mn2+/Fe2+ NRAMP family transporter
MANPHLTEADQAQLAQAAMRWYGWGSPIGLGAFIVCLALAGLVAAKAVSTFTGSPAMETRTELQLPQRSG